MMINLEKHAEAILRAAGVPSIDSFVYDKTTRAAILAALQAYGDECFEAGALAMWDTGVRVLKGTAEAHWVAAIDLASLRTKGQDHD